MKKNPRWQVQLSIYITQGEPTKIEKTKNWETAIGLQEVDGLKPSEYLVKTAKEHIEGKINFKEVKSRINSYYVVVEDNKKEETKLNEEADKVAVRIAEVLSDDSFVFSTTELINIHKKLFQDCFTHAGKIRNKNFIKKEWVLNNDSVTYAPFEIIIPSLEYDFLQEKNFSYKNLSLEESIKHLSRFASDIWQVHPFEEGNTRTTAVFIIKYLKTFGFILNDDTFANNSWYFRNALVRANYKNFSKNIFEDTSYLEKFFLNLLTDANYELKNRYAHIDYIDKDEKLYYKDCTLEEQAILKLVKENPNIKQEQIGKLIKKSTRTINTIMKQMQQKGLLTRKNGKKNGKLEIFSHIVF